MGKRKDPWQVPLTKRGREKLEALAGEYRSTRRYRELGETLSALSHLYKHVGTAGGEGAFSSAAAAGREAVRILRKHGDNRSLAIALRRAAVPFTGSKRNQRMLEESLRLCREIGDREQEGWTLYRMTRADGVEGYTLEEALACFDETGCAEGRATCLISLAIQEHPWRREWLVEAVSLYEASGDRRLAKMARLYVECHDMPDEEAGDQT